MKFNWGHGITLGLLAFVTFMLALVYKAHQTEFHLVSKDYYQEELEYQDRINRMENAITMDHEISHEVKNDSLRLSFPKEILPLEKGGKIDVFRPSDAEMDLELDLEPGPDGVQSIPLKKFVKGLYKLKISWEKNGKGYFVEKRVFI